MTEQFFRPRTAPTRELERREAEKANASRWATTELKVVTTGVGRARHDAVLAFPVQFVDEPIMAQGSGVIRNPDPKNYWDPEGTAGVWAWSRNAAGLYVGCKIWTSVTFEAMVASDEPDNETWKTVSVQHWLVFQGTALKGLSQEARDNAVALAPRTVHF